MIQQHFLDNLFFTTNHYIITFFQKEMATLHNFSFENLLEDPSASGQLDDSFDSLPPFLQVILLDVSALSSKGINFLLGRGGLWEKKRGCEKKVLSLTNKETCTVGHLYHITIFNDMRFH